LPRTLIVSHGQFAAHIVHAARRINAEPLAEFSVLCLEWDVSLASATEQVKEKLEEVGTEDGVLILTDLFGATPSNACRPFLQHGVVEMITGVNLPMVMRLGNPQNQPQTVSELAAWLRAKTIKGIVHLDHGPQEECLPRGSADG
jgi:PTS system mannose-specific IIA component